MKIVFKNQILFMDLQLHFGQATVSNWTMAVVSELDDVV